MYSEDDILRSYFLILCSNSDVRTTLIIENKYMITNSEDEHFYSLLLPDKDSYKA